MAIKSNSTKKARGFVLLLTPFLLLFAFQASGTPEPQKTTASFKSVWEGGIKDGECYYVAGQLLGVNFTSDTGEELAIVDLDNYGHVLHWTVKGFIEEWITSEPVAEQQIAKAIPADLDGDGLEAIILLSAHGAINIWGGENVSFRMLCRDCAADLRSQYKIRLIAASDFDGDSRDEIIAWAESKEKDYLLALEWTGKKLEIFSSRQIDGAGRALDLLVQKTNTDDEEYFLYETGGKLGKRLTNLAVDEEGIRVGNRLPLDKEHGKIISIWTGKPDRKSASAIYLLESRGGALYVNSMDPFNGDISSQIEKAPPQTRFVLSADIQGDGKEEIIFSEVNCKYNIYAGASAKAAGAKNSAAGKQH
jgi:hypothetical protein